MITSKNIYTFELSTVEGNILLTTQEYPWSVLQVIPTTAEEFDTTMKKLKTRGFVAVHDTDRTFCIIHLCSGSQGGKYPEREVPITAQNYEEVLQDIREAMAQAAVWYYTNVVKR